jgi:LmbE family N-acetylglucosaminyl deacetylase
MLPAHLDLAEDRALRILAIGAHSDDLEIGCGATLMSVAAKRDITVDWIVCATSGERAEEARASAAMFLPDADVRVRVEEFRDGFLPYEGAEVKEFFETLKPCAPDIIFTHRKSDAHQDHRLVAELTWNTFRDHTVLEYEVPKYDGDLVTPNVYVPLTEDYARRKVDLLLAAFPSQRDRRWFDPELFLALMRLRGMECNAASGYAEGFFGRKLALQW